MGKMSRDKGKRGELEIAELFREYGFSARRGQQHRGGADSPDVIHDMQDTYVEVKFRETMSIYPVLEKANEERECYEHPVVFYRRKNSEWTVVMYADDFMDLMRELKELRNAQ